MAVSPIKSLFVERSLSLFFSGPLCTLKCDTVWAQSMHLMAAGKTKRWRVCSEGLLALVLNDLPLAIGAVARIG